MAFTDIEEKILKYEPDEIFWKAGLTFDIFRRLEVDQEVTISLTKRPIERSVANSTYPRGTFIREVSFSCSNFACLCKCKYF